MKLKSIKLFRVLSILLVLITIIVSFQNYYLPSKKVANSDIEWSHYNNYEIFKYSFFHLVENENLYLSYPEEYYDLYKYSPTFSLFMGLFAYFPDLVGLILWNLLNVLILIAAIKYLPFENNKKHAFILLYIFIELITSLQNNQSNPLMTGLILWAFIQLEKKNIWLATLLIVASIYIKIFGVVAFAIFIFYPKKGKAILYSIGWAVVLFLLPLIFVSFSSLVEQYGNWLVLLQNDHSLSIGYSVMGWLETWFGIKEVKNLILFPGAFLLLLPLIRTKHYSYLQFRYWFLSSILIWMVIFNHKAESPTFIIAISGVAIWYFSQTKSTLNLVLVVLAFLFTILSPTDIFPKSIRENWVIPYVLKGVPCILIWFKITFDLLSRKRFLMTV